MADKIGELYVEIVADNKKFDSGIDQSRKETEKFDKGLGNLSGTVKKLLGAGALIALAGKIIDVGKASISAASDAEETQNKFNVVFSGISDYANDMAENLALSYGTSIQGAKDMLAGTGDLLTGLGFTQDSAFDLSRQVLTLGADLASFTNFSGGAEGASEALTKALLGERESLKALGISINEADLKAEVLRQTEEGLTFATEKQAKANATLTLVTNQSKNAIGDFARSSDSYANTLKVAKARTADLQAELGRALLPTATAGVGIFSALTGKLGEYIKGLNDVKEAENAQKEGNATRAQTLVLLNKNLKALEKERATQVEALKDYGDGQNKYGRLIQQNIDLKDISIAGIKRKLQAINEEIAVENEAEQAIRDAEQAEIDRLNTGLAAANELAETKVEIIEDERALAEEVYQEQLEKAQTQADAVAAIQKDFRDKQKEENEKARDEFFKLKQEEADFVQNISNSLLSIYKNYNQGQIDSGKKTADEIYKIQVEQFRVEQALALSQIAIDTAIGVAKVYGQTGIFGLAAQTPVIAAGALQAAAVLSQQPPQKPAFAQGGVATAATNAVVGEAGGEVMLGMGAAGAPLIEELATRIATISGGTGKTVININSMYPPRRQDLDRLARDLYSSNVKENQRRGI